MRREDGSVRENLLEYGVVRIAVERRMAERKKRKVQSQRERREQRGDKQNKEEIDRHSVREANRHMRQRISVRLIPLLPSKHLIDENAQRPPVSAFAVSLAQNDLWRNVFGCTTHRIRSTRSVSRVRALVSVCLSVSLCLSDSVSP